MTNITREMPTAVYNLASCVDLSATHSSQKTAGLKRRYRYLTLDHTTLKVQRSLRFYICSQRKFLTVLHLLFIRGTRTILANALYVQYFPRNAYFTADIPKAYYICRLLKKSTEPKQLHWRTPAP